MLDILSKKMGYSFAIASLYCIEEGFDFCGSGAYIIPRGSIKLQEGTLETRAS